MRKVDPVKHEEKRREILDAAGRCFVRDGFHGATTAAICAEAGISSGHLYHYFESKEAIIGALAQASLERTAVQLGRVAETADAMVALVLEMAKLDVMAKSPRQPLAFDILAEARRNAALSKVLHEHSQGMRKLLSDLIRKGQANGEIDPELDSDSVAMVLISVIDGIKSFGVRYAKLDAKRVSLTLRALVTRFLARPESPS